MRKGYIRPSKSPQTSLVFFVPKKERWEEEDGAELLVFEQLDGQEQLSITTDFGSDRQYWEEKGVHKDGFTLGI